MYAVDPGLIYRVHWCDECHSLRYAAIMRRSIRRKGGYVFIDYYAKCTGLPIVVDGKIRRLVLECGVQRIITLRVEQWNALVQRDAYAA